MPWPRPEVSKGYGRRLIVPETERETFPAFPWGDEPGRNNVWNRPLDARSCTGCKRLFRPIPLKWQRKIERHVRGFFCRRFLLRPLAGHS
jgi:hypothetical protein